MCSEADECPEESEDQQGAHLQTNTALEMYEWKGLHR